MINKKIVIFALIAGLSTANHLIGMNKKVLNLEKCTCADLKEIQKDKCETLEVLNLAKPKDEPTTKLLNGVLSACKNLKKLSLEEWCDIRNILDWKLVEWPPTLETLILKYARINEKNLNKMLSRIFSMCPNLTHLNLRSVEIASGPLNWGKIELPKNLKALDISYNDISSVDFKSLFANSTNLTHLIWKSIDELRDIGKYDWSLLENLQHLDFGNSVIYADNIEEMLSSVFKNLKLYFKAATSKEVVDQLRPYGFILGVHNNSSGIYAYKPNEKIPSAYEITL